MARYVTFVLLIIFVSPASSESLFQWTSNNFQLLHGSGFELGETHRTTVTFEHVNRWAYGDNFMFVDFVQRDDVGLQLYGEWYPRLSFNKMLKKDFSNRIFKDFFLVGGLNHSSLPERDPFKAHLLGIGTTFNLPFAGVFNLNVMAQKHDQENTTGIQVTPSWSIPFRIGKLKFRFDGFLDWVSASSSGGKPFILAQPQLLLDIGSLTGTREGVFLGLEYFYWRNKFGIDGVNDNAAQVMLKIDF